MYPIFGSYTKCQSLPIYFPPQYQPQQPGIQSIMNPQPISENIHYKGSEKLSNKVAIITGGDSGIGRAIAYAFAKEGAHIVIVYYNEHGDAEETKERVLQLGRHCKVFSGDIGDESFCRHVIEQTIHEFGSLDILVNNAAMQFFQLDIANITTEQLERTFRTNIFSCFYFAKAALQYLKSGSTIINTSSVTANAGYEGLIDYSATKGAINSFTRSLSLSLIKKGIRVNAVSPGSTWTPIVPATIPPHMYISNGIDTPIRRSAQPFELAPIYVYLASDDSSYVTGQIFHINGGAYFGQ